MEVRELAVRSKRLAVVRGGADAYGGAGDQRVDITATRLAQGPAGEPRAARGAQEAHSLRFDELQDSAEMPDLFGLTALRELTL